MNVALTGATGAVGSYLAHQLILQGRSLALIGRGPNFQNRAKERIGVWGEVDSWDRVRFLEWGETGNLQCDGVSCLIHSAADTDLSFRNAEARVETNLGLLDRALALCDRWKIPRFDLISTAYVCGNKVAPIPEERHRHTEGFRNPYEESKWLCEERLFEWSGRCPRVRVIHRPSLILPPVSHAKGNTPRAFARLFEKLRLLPGRTQGRSLSVSIPHDARMGFVSLVGFAEDFLNIVDRPIEEGCEIFQYSSGEAPPIREWVYWLRHSIPNLEVNLRETCPLGRRILGELEPYLRGEFVFDQSNLETFLGQTPRSQCPIAPDFLRGLLDRLIETADFPRPQLAEVER